MLGWTLAVAAHGWEPWELRAVDLGRVSALATVASWDGSPAWLVGGAGGVRVVDARSLATIGSLVGPVSSLLAQDLDGLGDAEVLACGPAGLRLLLGDREVLAERVLADEPCDAVVAQRRTDWPRLVSVGGGALVRWEPSSVGLARAPLDVVPGGTLLAASGWAVATVTADGRPWTSEEGPGPSVGPIAAVAGRPPSEGTPGFVWLVTGPIPRLARPGPDVPIDGSATGVVAAGDPVWVLDGDGRRLGVVEGDAVRWWPAPISPWVAARVDGDGDACADLLVSDGEGGSALVLGACGGAGAAAPPPRMVPTAPAEVLLGPAWAVVDARVGDPVVTRLAGGGRWRSVGGPPGFAVQSDGRIEFEPEAADVGRWRVSVRHVPPGRRPRWSGFELRVWPAEGTAPGPAGSGVVEGTSP